MPPTLPPSLPSPSPLPPSPPSPPSTPATKRMPLSTRLKSLFPTLPPLPSPLPLSPTLPSPAPPSPPPHELTPPPPSSIAAASPNPSEATEAKPNSRRTQEQADISSIGNSDANPIMKLQAQVPSNNRINPDNVIKSKPAYNDSDDTSNNDHDSSNCNGTYGSSNRGDSKFVYDPGGNDFNTKNCSTRDDSDDSSSRNSTD